MPYRLSRGQPAATIRRVGILAFGSEAAGAHMYSAFKQGMQEFGWLDGKNVEYRFRFANGDVARLDALASELIEQKVEVIVAGSSSVTRAAQRATKTIPIVMVGVSNAVGTGYVASLAKPEANITGISNQREEALGKLIGILHEVTPGARRIAILLNDSNSSYGGMWAAAQSACAALDLVALRIVASTPAQLGSAVEQIVRQQSQAVAVVPDTVYFNERAKLQVLMQATRLPAAYGLREHVVAGGLLSYAADLAASFRHAAKYVEGLERCQARRSSRRATDQIRFGDQPQDCEITRTHNPAVAAVARGRGDSVVERSKLLATQALHAAIAAEL